MLTPLLLAMALLSDGEPSAGDPCLMGGFKPGMAFDSPGDKTRFNREKPKVYRPKGADLYRVLGQQHPTWVEVVDWKVVAVIREYEGDDADKVYLALEQKHGDAALGSLVPEVKTKFHPFGGSVIMETRALWQDTACGHAISFIRQNKTTILAYGGSGGGRAAVVVSASDSDPETGESNLLK